jgi:alpha-glucosidase (family GH31 glycosyl hydrolase)
VLNIHPSIDDTDPQFAAAQKTAGGGLTSPPGGCAFYRSSPKCYVFDWGKPAQAKAYFNLQNPFLDDGISAFWLDWCCDASTVSTPGLTPDSWINNLYAQQLIARGQRGFVLSRIGSGIFDLNSYLGDLDAPASGAWADHRSAIAFTGDAASDWQTLAYEAQFTPAESAAIGEPYISNDIGGYSGNHLADALYVRWVQLGAFSPIMRLHSNHGERLPWDYNTAAELPAEEFLRLREALVPYLYDTAWQATQTGLPMAREMVIGWPSEPAALKATSQWMLGDSLLAAPITSAGTTGSRSVWFPPGVWDDFFTGQQITGPSSQTVTDGFSQAPVYIKGGGIVPMAPPMSYSSQHSLTPLTLRVGAAGSGSTTLYEDAGTGLGYQHGQYAKTHIRYVTDGFGDGQLKVFPTQGSFPGQIGRRAYIVQIVGVGEPLDVEMNGRPEAGGPTGPLNLATTFASTAGYDTWSYDVTTRTLTVSVVRQSIRTPLSVSFQSAGAPLPVALGRQVG